MIKYYKISQEKLKKFPNIKEKTLLQMNIFEYYWFMLINLVKKIK